MSQRGVSTVSECNPAEAWEGLEKDQNALLVDVRSRPEWSFVGIPDLTSIGRKVILVEWREFPAMQVNDGFARKLDEETAGAQVGTIYFLCRSGARSMEAATTMAAHYDQTGRSVTCVNVAEGFEGDLDADRHRGAFNGWKARGLSWRQS